MNHIHATLVILVHYVHSSKQDDGTQMSKYAQSSHKLSNCIRATGHHTRKHARGEGFAEDLEELVVQAADAHVLEVELSVEEIVVLIGQTNDQHNRQS